MRPVLIMAASVVSLLAFQNFTAVQSDPTGATSDIPCNQQTADSRFGKGSFFTVSGRPEGERSYLLQIDSVYSQNQSKIPAEVVFVFHGGFGNGCDMINATQLTNIMEKNGNKNRPFVFIFPNGVTNFKIYGDSGQHWNDGRKTASPNTIDDVGYVHQVADLLVSKHKLNINKNRMFAVGVSNGGMFTYRLARDSNRFAGVAAISALLPKELIESGKKTLKPVPTLIIQGTEDDRMPYEGGTIDSQVSGEVLSAEATFKKLLETIDYPKVVGESYDKGHEYLMPGISKISWQGQEGWAPGKRNRRRMELTTIYGGAHCWPGPQNPAKTAGRSGVCDSNFDASSWAMSFFDAAPDLSSYDTVNKGNYISYKDADVWYDRPVSKDFPHKADFLYPKNRSASTKAIVVIHGGGGQKFAFAHDLGIKSLNQLEYVPGDLNEAFLRKNNVALIFVQGQSLGGDDRLDNDSRYTWSNTIMTSGYDDKALLTKLAGDLRKTYGFSKVYLMGHSMGGSMTNLMWCQASDVFEAFGSSAGPMSRNLSQNCKPKVLKPYMHVAGLNDQILQVVEYTKTGRKIDNSKNDYLYLEKTTQVMGRDSMVHEPPEFRNELTSFADRVASMCGEKLQPAVSSPNTSDWKTKTNINCGNKIKLIQVRGADHCTGSSDASGGYLCEQPLTTPGQSDHIQRFIDFFNQN